MRTVGPESTVRVLVAEQVRELGPGKGRSVNSGTLVAGNADIGGDVKAAKDPYSSSRSPLKPVGISE